MNEVTAVTVMAILPSQEDRLCLRKIFCQSKWRLDVSECLRGARPLLGAPRINVVVTDCQLPDGGWEDVLHEVERGPARTAPIIVVSRLADERLWAEVLNLRGYDVLATPFRADEVRWSIRSAYRHWRNNCMLSTHEGRTDANHSLARSKAAAGGRNSSRMPPDVQQAGFTR